MARHRRPVGSPLAPRTFAWDDLRLDLGADSCSLRRYHPSLRLRLHLGAFAAVAEPSLTASEPLPSAAFERLRRSFRTFAQGI